MSEEAAKLAAAASSVEVVRTCGSGGGSGRLTRQLIPLLAAGGVPAAAFQDRQRKAAERLLKVLTEPMLEYRAARAAELVQILQAQPPAPTDPGNPNSVSRGALANMLVSGFSQSDRYVSAECRRLVRRQLVGLRSGQIPVEESGYAMGCADPTGTLPEGQIVYIRDGAPQLGEMLVYKSPGLHPGDVRKLRAVAHAGVLAEVMPRGVSKQRATLLVFSVRGARAEADKIANSDLDGDEYLVRGRDSE